MHVRQDFEPLRAIEFGYEIRECELKVLRLQMFRQAKIHIVAREQFAITLAGQRRMLPKVIERVARRDVKWPVDIDQGAIEIEENRFETAFQADCRRANLKRGASTSRAAAHFD